MKKHWIAASGLAVLLVVGVMAQQGGNGKGGSNLGQGPAGAVEKPAGAGVCTAPEVAPLTAQETADVLFLREEEKMAGNLYAALGKLWDSPVFSNLQRAEARHQAALEGILEAQGIPMPEAAYGKFSYPDLQKAFDTLSAQGSESLLAALNAGALVEEMDIADLRGLQEMTANEGLLFIYGNLEKGSRNHLRAFVRNLELNGEEYESQVLSAEDVAVIVDSPTERGGCGAGSRAGGRKGSGQGGGKGPGDGSGDCPNR